jgi:hypothetical protein
MLNFLLDVGYVPASEIANPFYFTDQFGLK